MKNLYLFPAEFDTVTPVQPSTKYLSKQAFKFNFNTENTKYFKMISTSSVVLVVFVTFNSFMCLFKSESLNCERDTFFPSNRRSCIKGGKQ